MYRTGIGFDVHPLVIDKPLIIGGVKIPHTHGLLGHSDADVLIHAIIDGILGALALGDIGTHFPDTNAKYRGVDSLSLLARVHNMAKERGFICSNIDTIIMAQEPKMNPHISKMRINLSEVLMLGFDEVSIKATTTENLGFIGRKEGIAAQAIVLYQSVKKSLV